MSNKFDPFKRLITSNKYANNPVFVCLSLCRSVCTSKRAFWGPLSKLYPNNFDFLRATFSHCQSSSGTLLPCLHSFAIKYTIQKCIMKINLKFIVLFQFQEFISTRKSFFFFSFFSTKREKYKQCETEGKWNELRYRNLMLGGEHFNGRRFLS